MKIQQFKTLVVTAGVCSKCGEALSRKNSGRAVTVVTQKRRRYIGQRFCLTHLPDEKKLRELLTAIPGATRKARIQKARDEAQAAGMREADLLDYCNRCGNKGAACKCPGGPYFP
ncbi:MAG: hypothetical protein AAB229_10490 [Candidatus Hydrogenedentota bacterium]